MPIHGLSLREAGARHGLELTWRPKQQDSFAGAREASRREEVGKLQGQLHSLPQRILGPLQSSHICKAAASFLQSRGILSGCRAAVYLVALSRQGAVATNSCA